MREHEPVDVRLPALGPLATVSAAELIDKVGVLPVISPLVLTTVRSFDEVEQNEVASAPRSGRLTRPTGRLTSVGSESALA